MIIKIDESLITGIKDIDEQHRLLFEAINRLSEDQISFDQIRATMLDLEKYACEHFDTEEKYMHKYNYSDINDHAQKHRDFLEKFKKIKILFDADNFSQEFLIELRTFLVQWITTHYKETDVKLADFLKQSF
jgi:hemerythrin